MTWQWRCPLISWAPFTKRSVQVLSDLAVVSVEKAEARRVDWDDLINETASERVRKVFFVKVLSGDCRWGGGMEGPCFESKNKAWYTLGIVLCSSSPSSPQLLRLPLCHPTHFPISNPFLCMALLCLPLLLPFILMYALHPYAYGCIWPPIHKITSEVSLETAKCVTARGLGQKNSV